MRKLILKAMKAIFPKLAEKCGNLWVNYWMKKDPRIMANRAFKAAFGRNIDWKNPKSLIEKIYWLQIYSDTSQWTLCADKYRVREYVKDKVGESCLNELYGKWDKPEDIDFDALPNSFVIKTNHGCGEVYLVKDKSKLDIEKLRNQLKEWLKVKYGYSSVQLHYTKIKPCIIAEKLLINEDHPDKSLVDYKIWCFNGVPECVLVVFDRDKSGYHLSAFDLNWNNISAKVFNENAKSASGKNIAKPKSFENMIDIASKLSKGLPETRVDFYDINGQTVFGEMTFSTAYGYYKDEYYDYLGDKVDLSLAKLKCNKNK